MAAAEQVSDLEVASTRAAPARSRHSVRALLGGGTDGNEQLTSLTGAVLIVLLAVLGITILRIRQLIGLHLFLGLLLLGPIALKMGSTGYRFARYYTSSATYRSKGPPQASMRLLAPLVVASTLAVFATGVLLLIVGPRHRGSLVGLHKVSFIVWLAATGVHILGHLPELRRILRPPAINPLLQPSSGTAGRWLALSAALVAGAVLAVVLVPEFASWTAQAGRMKHAAAQTKDRLGRRQRSQHDPVLARLGLPPLHGSSPLPGYLMVADRDNNRIIIVNPSKQIVWRFPGPGALRPGQAFAGPDDAFISADRRTIITNEEFSDAIAVVSLLRDPHIIWQYGHQDVQGSGPGYLAHPDDAYLLSNGLVQVADIINCRILWITPSKRIVRSIGSAGDCVHDPPRAVLQPNGDTPLADGGVLVTEIGGWIDRFSRTGALVWSIKAPTTYPSDAQLLPGGDVLVAGFNQPGRIDILTPGGRIVWTYLKTSGSGELDQPSIAIMLPNGMVAATDDWNHRVVIIDRKTHEIVWQYGQDGTAGSGSGYLNKPDGLELLP